MRFVHLAALFLVCLPARVAADEAISAKTLAAIKQATVYVKVQSEGINVSGSGFVMKVDGDSALIVTNHHVIEPKFKVIVPGGPRTLPKKPSKIKRPRPLPPPVTTTSPRTLILTLKNTSVSVVFDSGTKKEREAKAEVVAADPQHDLAVLRVKDVKNLPEPVEFSKSLELTETMPVYTFGFPFGKSLSTTKGGPAITVSKAAISSLRQDDNGELALVQIDGNLNPGNSGGPVVDAAGRLVGVAVAIIRDSNGIAFAIPGDDLRKMMQGRLGTYHLVSKEAGQGKTSVDIEVGMIDPLNKITAVTLYYVPASKAGGKADALDSLESVPGSSKLQLTIEKQLASGKVMLEKPATEKEWLLQAKYVNGTGKEVKTRVVRHQFNALAAGKEAPRPTDPVSKDGHTKILGGFNDPQFKDVAPEGGRLVGFEVGYQKFFNLDLVGSIRPIYRTATGEVKGKQYGKDTGKTVTVKAKADYAVGSINVKVGALVNGFSVNFMRVSGDRLDAADTYESEWIGDKTGGGGPLVLGGQGTPVIGVIGKSNDRQGVTGLGLVLKTGSGQSTGKDDSKTPTGKEKEPSVVPVGKGKEYTPKNKRFSILMPEGVRSGEATRILAIGRFKVPVEASQTMLKNGTTYTAASIGVPAVVMRDIPPDKRFDVFRDLIVKQLKGKVVEEKDIKQGAVPGKDYQIQGGKMARLQIYRIGGFILYAYVQGSAEAVSSNEANAFFSSFIMAEEDRNRKE